MCVVINTGDIRLIMRLTRQRTFVLLLCFGLAFLSVYFYLLSRDHNCSSGLECFIGVQHTDKNLALMCVLPRLDPFDQSIRHLITNYSDDITNVCGKSSKVFQLVDGRIKIRDFSLLENISEKSAKYETVIRPKGEDDRIMYGDMVFISQHDQKINSDFLKVSYKLKNGSRKVEMFAQIVEKQSVFKRQPKNTRPRPNVVLMGFDSTSNANFKRKLSRSFRYLVEKLDAFVFNGYTIIGDGTTPALTAVLTGNLLSTMVANNHTYLDSWPWIMKNYKRKGYVTLYAEDDPQVASFTKLGSFHNEPADHYIRPFWLSVERHGLDGRRRNKSASLHRLCLNNEPLHNITLNYVKDFLAAYDGMPKFAFPFFSYLPHGTGEKLSYADKDLLLFLKNYEKYRNNTIFIIFGDHGARVGRIRNTIQGTYEEHLPWLSIVLPPWFEEKYPVLTKNLKVNQDRVISPFDLHYTLHQILNLDRKPAGTSLMSELNPQRTCSEAGVSDEHWCPCLRWQAEDINSTPIKRAAQLLVNHINKIISKKRMFVNLCFTVYLVEIILAARAEAGRESENGNIVYYQVTIATKPGDGVFQATFRLYPDSKMVMTSHISRTNMYRRNPWCLGRNYHYMRRYCTCKIPHRNDARKRMVENMNASNLMKMSSNRSLH